MRAFADALDSVPMALAENSGLSPIETLANIKSRQAKEKNTRLGVDCMQTGSNGKCKSVWSILPVSFSSNIYYLRLAAAVRTFFSLHRRCSCSHRGGSGHAYVRGPVVHTSNACTGCSVTPPRNNNALHIQRCNHERK